LKKFIIFIITLFIAKIYILNALNIDLFYDETYYYYWSKHLNFGYYSKPPMIAYVIYIFTHIFGNSELAIRLTSNLFYSLTAVIIYLIAKETFKKEKIALLSGLITWHIVFKFNNIYRCSALFFLGCNSI